MRHTHSAGAAFAFCLMAFLCQIELSGQGMLLNPRGWSLPDKDQLVLDRINKVKYPGIEGEIIEELWKLPKGSRYRIKSRPHWRTNPLSEEVLWFTIIKGPDNKVLCYKYARLFSDPKSGASLGGTSTYICDLDNDGQCESQIDGGSDEKNSELLTSILKVKLGLSKEAELVRRIIRAALQGNINK